MASSSRLIPHEHMLLEDGFAPNESTRSWAEAAGESTCPAYGSDPHWTCPTSIERWPCVYFRLLYKKIEDEATRREDEEENTRKQNKPNCTYESEGERERKRLAHISDTRLVQERLSSTRSPLVSYAEIGLANPRIVIGGEQWLRFVFDFREECRMTLIVVGWLSLLLLL